MLKKPAYVIGSTVASVLCDIYLASVDTCIRARIADYEVINLFRYVDDYLVSVAHLVYNRLQKCHWDDY